MLGSVGGIGSTAASLYGISQGLQRGGVTGNAQAALGAASLANRAGFLGGNNSATTGALGAASGALGIYNGIQQGGVAGYGGATVGALRLGSGVASLAGDANLAGTLGSAAGYVAAPLSVYNAVSNWRSGATGSDALQGAEAGAAVGSIIPGIGTIAGALIGGAAGAISSAFGGGQTDPETKNWNGFINATGGANATPAQVTAATQNMSPQTAFNLLSGVMDIKDGRIPIVNAFGHMGESGLLNSMTGEINNAISSGKISKNASPQDIYSQIVEPWLNSKGATITPETGGLQLQAVLQNLIGSWQNGQLTSATQLTSTGSTDKSLPAYAG